MNNLKQIYRKKILDIIEKNELLYIFKQGFLFLVSVFLIYIFTYPEKGLKLFKAFWIFENMIIGKSFVIIYIVFNYRDIRKRISKMNLVPTLMSLPKKQDSNKINGIKSDDLIKHLLIEKSFKVLEIEKKFNISKSQTYTLCKKLEDVGILIRGVNNSRILNEDYSEEQISKAIIFADGELENIRIHHEEIEENFYTTTPLNRV